MKEIVEKYRIEFLIISISLLLFIPFLGNVHLFDWDEVNFAEAAREMLVTGDYLTVRVDFEPFHEKPPFFIWLQALSMNIFGINEFAARFPNAIIGVITLLLLFKIGKRIIDEKFGLIWVISYIGSFLPHFYFKTGIIDPTFNLLIFIGIYFIFLYFFNYNSKSFKYIIYSGISLGIAVLTKGPVGLFIPLIILFIYYLINRETIKFPIKEILILSTISLIPIILWYVLISVNTEKNIINDFIYYQYRLLFTSEAGHGQPFYYHFIVLLFGCFPSSVLMLRGFAEQSDELVIQNIFKKIMIIMFAVVLIIFSIVKTKIIHYSSLTYFPITFLASYGIYGIITKKIRWKVTSSWLIGIIGFIIGTIITSLIYLLINKYLLFDFIRDNFTKAILSKNVLWFGYEYIIGIVFLIILVFSLIKINNRKYLQGLVILYVNTIITLSYLLPIVVPKIDDYIQGTAISYYKRIGEFQLGYLYVYDIPNYKYGYLFYGNKRMENSSFYNSNLPKGNLYEKWLFEGNIDKDVFIITKNTKFEQMLNKYSDMKLIDLKDGIAVLKRGNNHSE